MPVPSLFLYNVFPFTCTYLSMHNNNMLVTDQHMAVTVTPGGCSSWRHLSCWLWQVSRLPLTTTCLPWTSLGLLYPLHVLIMCGHTCNTSQHIISIISRWCFCVLTWSLDCFPECLVSDSSRTAFKLLRWFCRTWYNKYCLWSSAVWWSTNGWILLGMYTYVQSNAFIQYGLVYHTCT